MTLSAADYAWAEKFPEFPNTGMNTNKAREVFVHNGTVIFQALEQALKDYAPGKAIEEMTILDYGCGIGRVAMPFHHKYGRPTHVCDVSKRYIDWIGQALPAVDAHRSTFDAPLKFEDNTFDALYSISVWTHMDEAKGFEWLNEMKRILKPGGLALISTSSYGQLAKHREHPQKKDLWGDVTDEMVKEQGIVFRGEDMPGIGGTYGITVHDPDWVMSEFSKIMPVQETRIRNIGGAEGGAQDLNIMIKS